MKTKLKLFAVIVFALAAALRVGAQAPPQFFTIHNFNGSAGDGASPIGNLVEDPDGNIYGVTQNGGMNNSNNGTFYALLPAGGNSYNYTNFYSFPDGTNGGNPVGDLTLQVDGQTANLAGGQDKSPIKVKPQGAFGEPLHSWQQTKDKKTGKGTMTDFAWQMQNGLLIEKYLKIIALPDSTDSVFKVEGQITKPEVVASGNTLYGINIIDPLGAAIGEVYSLNTNGTGYTALHNFGGQPDGFFPNYSLTLSGNTLYGTTRQDGSNRGGTVWKVNTDGSGYAILHNFTNNFNPYGQTPIGGMVISGSTLYGTTSSGGGVFSINTNGSGFQVISAGGAGSTGDLILSGNTLFGTVEYGGVNGGGSVFSVNTNGGNFTVLYSFSQPTPVGGGVYTNSDGCYPTGVYCCPATRCLEQHHLAASMAAARRSRWLFRFRSPPA